MDRRKLLSLTVAGTGCAIAGAVGVPVLINMLAPAFAADDVEDWRPIGPLGDFPIGAMQNREVVISDQKEHQNLSRRSLYVWRRSDQEFVVYSRACTDLGCPIVWDQGSEWFFCPCHGGIFDKEGERRAGPPKRGLWKYATRIQDGVLEINVRSVPPMA
ncbi:ubiquinol-cytochrome c reductase iron-sulfur subunit [Oligoflexus tunisiensis]|uniref:QcrA and Rieske domain-containing protein n=1 Tax=Oligoflexus tunisiensis TaxID=708132 RepID=UPI00114D2B2D|nr:Rieske 2Fe-2S domain-containing protein [Oligoflexus tunisiensis]